MFAESGSNVAGQPPQWLKSLARNRPVLFDGVLIVLAMAVTVILLAQKQYSFVLYQGF